MSSQDSILPLIREPCQHIDTTGGCCMDSWIKHSAEVLGWQPAELKEWHCPVAIVCECPTCFTKWWTHWVWIPVPHEMLPETAVERLKAMEAA